MTLADTIATRISRQRAAIIDQRRWSRRDTALDTLWLNMEAAGARLGWRSRADVPYSVRTYMFNKLDALRATDKRFALHYGRAS